MTQRECDDPRTTIFTHMKANHVRHRKCVDTSRHGKYTRSPQTTCASDMYLAHSNMPRRRRHSTRDHMDTHTNMSMNDDDNAHTHRNIGIKVAHNRSHTHQTCTRNTKTCHGSTFDNARSTPLTQTCGISQIPQITSPAIVLL